MSKAFQASATNQDIEVTLEANPSDVSQDKLKGFLQAGINRLSMGFQVWISITKKAVVAKQFKLSTMFTQIGG